MLGHTDLVGTSSNTIWSDWENPNGVIKVDNILYVIDSRHKTGGPGALYKMDTTQEETSREQLDLDLQVCTLRITNVLIKTRNWRAPYLSWLWFIE